MRNDLRPEVIESALTSFATEIGGQWVLSSPEASLKYGDPYSPRPVAANICRGAVMPGCTEEVQAVVRVAMSHGVPIWPISRGQNLGYGGSGSITSDSFLLDLSRMNRIIDIDERRAMCVLEPGVGFEQLFNHLRTSNIPLWPSIPGNPLGSVVGNALERGVSRSPYGEHSSQICGLEVVLPDAQLVRTGMGAMSGGTTWHLYGGGFGPSWDQMFVQSNLGVVTRAGVWLQPEPEATMRVRIRLADKQALAWAIDEIAALRLHCIIDHPVVIGNYLHELAVHSTRTEWYCGEGSIPDDVAERLMDQHGTGWWNFSLCLFGPPELLQTKSEIVCKRLADRVRGPLEFEFWRRGEALAGSAATLPDRTGLQVVDWMGPEGAHINCSPVLPADGSLALAHADRSEQLFRKFGFDYCATFVAGERHLRNINTVLFKRDGSASVHDARSLCMSLIDDAYAHGYGEYRSHLEFMQTVSDSFDFNAHAIRSLNERVKDALDPAGILAPGKNGIWPRRFRDK